MNEFIYSNLYFNVIKHNEEHECIRFLIIFLFLKTGSLPTG